MTRRGAIAAGILVAWLAGLGMLVRREVFKEETEQLSSAALRVTPGTMYYAVLHEGEHVGYALSTVDTLPDTLRVTDYMVADLPANGSTERAEVRSEVLLSRGLRLHSFTMSVNTPSVKLSAEGLVEGVATLRVIRRETPASRPDTQQVALDGAVLLPTVVPLAVALTRPPAVGQQSRHSVYHPVRRKLDSAVVRLAAETLFVVPDSAVLDARTRRWTGAIPIETRAWRLESDTPGQVTGWVDEQGRMVRWSPFEGVVLERMPHEMAFENWRSATRQRTGATPPAIPDSISRQQPASPR